MLISNNYNKPMANESELGYWTKRLVDRPINPMRAMRFEAPDALEKATDIIDRLDAEEPLGLIHAPTKRRPSVILSEISYSRLLHALEEQGVDFREVDAVPTSLLPVDDQRLFRRRPR